MPLKKFINIRQLIFLIVISIALIVGHYIRKNNSEIETSELEKEVVEAWDIRNKPINFSGFALCQIECCSLSQKEVTDVLLFGITEKATGLSKTISGRDSKNRTMRVFVSFVNPNIHLDSLHHPNSQTCGCPD